MKAKELIKKLEEIGEENKCDDALIVIYNPTDTGTCKFDVTFEYGEISLTPNWDAQEE